MLAVFLFFLFPSIFLHTQARERAYRIWISEWKAYEELIQKQGYITVSVLEQFGKAKGGLFGELELEIWRLEEDKEGGKESQAILEITPIWYLEEWVYPLRTGDVLEVRIKMPFDFLEKLYYAFCMPENSGRYRVGYIMIRDGILERIDAGQAEQ